MTSIGDLARPIAFLTLLLAGGLAEGAVTSLAVAVQPRCTLSGRAIAPGVVVHVLADGVLDPTYGGVVTAGKALGGGALSGTITATAVGGVATFPDLRLTVAGTHALRFTVATGQSVDSPSFAIREIPYTTRGGILAEHQISDSVHGATSRYRLFVPSSAVVGATPSAANPVPVIIYGHPAGQYGDPWTMINGAFGQRVRANAATYPFFAVFPAIADTRTTIDKAGWMVALPELVARLKADGYHVDLDRIYYYGYSTGAIHLLDLVARHPDFWAAMAAVDATVTSAHLTDRGLGPPTGHLPGSFYDATGADAAAMTEIGRIAAESGIALSFHQSATSAAFVNAAGRDIRDLGPVFDAIDARVAVPFLRSSGPFTTVTATTAPRVFRQYTTLNHGTIEATVASAANWPAMEAWFAAQRRVAAIPVSITTPPTSRSVTVGQTATFTVVAAGTAPLVHQWRRNGTPIAGATAASYTTPATLSGDDGALFSVVVANAVGAATSADARLTVIRPPERRPFGGTPRAVPGRVQAEDFDEGGEGIAYHDATATNSGRGYRATGVDIRACTDAGGGWQVGWFGAGEWLSYTIEAATAGSFAIEARVASSSGATIRIAIDGIDVVQGLRFAGTGGADTWRTIAAPAVAVGAGRHVVRLTCEAGWLDLNWIAVSVPRDAIATGQWYRLVARHSGKCLAVTASSAVRGANVLQWTDDGSAGEAWRIDAVADGAYTLTARCSGQVLDISAGSLRDGGDAIQWTLHGGANQRWRLEDTGGGWYRVANVHSGKVLHVRERSAVDGADVVQWTDLGGDHQRWMLVPVAPVGTAAIARPATGVAGG
ncbi:MAG TPA: RICIN domain-containing protein [Planctomycetota bacterium]|nr:RICIN domain-containing protein [Planctomycetota bacterium]